MTSPRITRYKFEDAKRGVWALVAGHAVLGLILLMPDATSLLTLGRGQICLLLALLYAAAQRYYDWLDRPINIGLIGLYIGLLIVEFSALGIPETLQKVTTYGPPSKGTMLTVILYAIPPVYVGLRVVMVAQLVQAAVWAERMKIRAEMGI